MLLDTPDFGELKVKLRRIEKLEKENESLKLKGKKSLELEKTFEERIIHLQNEIATLRSFMI